MKATKKTVLIALVLASLVLSACATAPAAPGAAKVRAEPIEFTGVVESIVGTTWVVDGKTFTAEPAALGAGTFDVGDTVEVEGSLAPDGSITATSVKLEDDEDENANEGNENDANSNDVNGNDDNSNDVNGNDDNSNDANANDDNSNDANSNDDNSNSTGGGTDDNTNDGGGGGSDDNSSGSGGDDDSGSGSNSNDD